MMLHSKPMKVHITKGGWHGGFAPLFAPYWSYTLTAANGIITKVYSTADYEDGDYELPDEDWSYDNPRWEEEKDCEEIEIA